MIYMTFLGGVLGPFYSRKRTGSRPKTPLKKSYRSYFRRAQIRWVIWRPSRFTGHTQSGIILSDKVCYCWCYNKCFLESVSVHPVYGNPRTGLLRTLWGPDRVLRSPLRGLCVQGALSCPTRRAFLCTLYTETPERASKNLLQPTQGS